MSDAAEAAVEEHLPDDPYRMKGRSHENLCLIAVDPRPEYLPFRVAARNELWKRDHEKETAAREEAARREREKAAALEGQASLAVIEARRNEALTAWSPASEAGRLLALREGRPWDEATPPDVRWADVERAARELRQANEDPAIRRQLNSGKGRDAELIHRIEQRTPHTEPLDAHLRRGFDGIRLPGTVDVKAPERREVNYDRFFPKAAKARERTGKLPPPENGVW